MGNTVTIRLDYELLEECKKAIVNGKAKNMSQLVKKALISYLQLNPDYYLVTL